MGAELRMLGSFSWLSIGPMWFHLPERVKYLHTGTAMLECAGLCAWCWLHMVFHLGWKFLPQSHSLESLEQIWVGCLGWYLTAELGCVTVMFLIKSSEPKNKFLTSCRTTTQIPHDVWIFVNVVTGLCAAGLSLLLSKQNHDFLVTSSHGSWLWAGWDNHIPFVWPKTAEILGDREGWSRFKRTWEERLCSSAGESCCYWSINTAENNWWD